MTLISAFTGSGIHTVADVIIPGHGRVGTIRRSCNTSGPRKGSVDRYEVRVGDITRIVRVTGGDTSRARIEAQELARTLAEEIYG